MNKYKMLSMGLFEAHHTMPLIKKKKNKTTNMKGGVWAHAELATLKLKIPPTPGGIISKST